MTIALERAPVLAWRALAQGLAGPPGDSALDAGLQDYPPGRTARAALALRTGVTPGADAVLVHSMRAALHLHRRADLALLAAALRIEDGRDLAIAGTGRFGVELAAEGLDYGRASDEVAAALTQVMADGRALTKGALSTAVSPMVDPRLVPWCPGCGVHHVQDALFRAATLQAGLVAEVDAPPSFRFARVGLPTGPDRDTARAELVRRFLHLGGPARPAQLARWLSLTPRAARRWWDLVAAELTPVQVCGIAAWMLSADVDRAADGAGAAAAASSGWARLLPPYDPWLELADRELMVPDAGARRSVWAAAANPGVLLVDGEVGGVWRHRSRGERLVITLTPLAAARTEWVPRVRADAELIAACWGAGEVELAAQRA